MKFPKSLPKTLPKVEEVRAYFGFHENVPSAPERMGQCAVVFIRERPRTKARLLRQAGRPTGRAAARLSYLVPSLVAPCQAGFERIA